MLPQQLSSFNNQIPLRYPIKNISTTTYAVSTADLGQILSFTGSVASTVTIPSAAIVGAGFNFYIWNQLLGGVPLTLTPPSGVTIDYFSPYILRGNEGLQLISDGLNWQISNKKPMRLYAENTSSSGTTRPVASSLYSIAIGNGAIASGSYAYVLGGASSSATQLNSYALGTNATCAVAGKTMFGSPSITGSASWGIVSLGVTTSTATSTTLTSDGNGAGSTNQIILPNNSAFTFSILVVARQQAAGGTASAAWKIEGLIRQEATASTTTIVASTTTVISNVPGWSIAIGSDTTNGALAIVATGAAATNIRWLATAYTSEVNYA